MSFLSDNKSGELVTIFCRDTLTLQFYYIVCLTQYLLNLGFIIFQIFAAYLGTYLWLYSFHLSGTCSSLANICSISSLSLFHRSTYSLCETTIASSCSPIEVSFSQHASISARFFSHLLDNPLSMNTTCK